MRPMNDTADEKQAALPRRAASVRRVVILLLPAFLLSSDTGFSNIVFPWQHPSGQAAQSRNRGYYRRQEPHRRPKFRIPLFRSASKKDESLPATSPLIPKGRSSGFYHHRNATWKRNPPNRYAPY